MSVFLIIAKAIAGSLFGVACLLVAIAVCVFLYVGAVVAYQWIRELQLAYRHWRFMRDKDR